MRLRHTSRAKAAPAFLTASAAMLRTCPICQAGANRSCRRWISGRYTVQQPGEDGGYWRPISTMHPERAGRKPKKPRTMTRTHYPTAQENADVQPTS